MKERFYLSIFDPYFSEIEVKTVKTSKSRGGLLKVI